MDSQLKQDLIAQTQEHGYAYLRNLAAAESAVLRGQFNLAKVLRAAAHSHRVLGLETARLYASEFPAQQVLQSNLDEFAHEPPPASGAPEPNAGIQVQLKQSAVVRARLREIMHSSLHSLESHPDVTESDVPQSLWGCYNCGNVVEGTRPDVCPVCGALGVESEWFGPFYSVTAEHLGQLTPAEILITLERISDQLADMVHNVPDAALSAKPSAAEWSINETIGHMLETDYLFVRRVRTILQAEGLAEIATPTPPWKLHEGKGYEDMARDELLERFKQNRALTVELVRSLLPEQWMRRGSNGGTSTSILDLGTWLARHDQGHTAQIRRLAHP